MGTGCDAKLMDASRRIAPVIRAHREETEHNRRLSRPALDAMAKAGLLRMLTPRSLAGNPDSTQAVVFLTSIGDVIVGW